VSEGGAPDLQPKDQAGAAAAAAAAAKPAPAMAGRPQVLVGAA
jgi:hypothetical protein